jgi:hypothetical protein
LATNAGIAGPSDIFIDQAGTIFIVDEFFDRVRGLPLSRPSFQVSSTNLAFTAPAGSAALDQHLDVTGAVAGIPFTITSSAAWLTATPAACNMPAGITVSVGAVGLSAGSYQRTLTISAPTSSTVALTVQIALTVNAAGQPSLSVKPGSLSFSTVVNSLAGTRGIDISNLGGGSIAFTAAASAAWLTLSSTAGTLSAFGSQSILATLNPAGLPAGTYPGIVTVSSINPAQKVTLPVTMTVTQVEQTILIPQNGLTFYAVATGGAPPPQFFSILNTGRGQMPFTTRVSTLSGGNWLRAFPAGGTSDAASTVVPQVRIDVDPAGFC